MKVNGYNVVRTDRISHASHGVAMFVKSSNPFKYICMSACDSDVEYLFIEISSVDSKIWIGTVYRPNRYIDISSILDVVEEFIHPYANIVLGGDFNSNLLRENHLSLKMSALGLHSCNTSLPTHFTCTLLELFFVNDLSKSLLYDQIFCPVFSKHLIFLVFNLKKLP